MKNKSGLFFTFGILGVLVSFNLLAIHAVSIMVLSCTLLIIGTMLKLNEK